MVGEKDLVLFLDETVKEHDMLAFQKKVFELKNEQVEESSQSTRNKLRIW